MVQFSDFQVGTKASNLSRDITLLSAIVIVSLIIVIIMQMLHKDPSKLFGGTLAIFIIGIAYIRFVKYRVFINMMTHNIDEDNILENIK